MTQNNLFFLPAQPLYPEIEDLGAATLFLDEIFEFVEFIPLLDSFDKSDIETLASYMPCFGSPGGVELLREGDEGDYLLLILTGEMIIHKRDPISGEYRRIAVAGPGATLGEMSLIDGEPRFASCSTVSPTDVAVLTRKALDEVAHKHPALGHRLMLVLLKLLTRRLRDTTNDLVPLLAMSPIV